VTESCPRWRSAAHAAANCRHTTPARILRPNCQPPAGWEAYYAALSFMYLGNAQELLDLALAAPEGAAAGVAVLAAWLRLAAVRKLRWNVNYNVKPREISAAQVRCWLGSKP
jgi:hypothetical protein